MGNRQGEPCQEVSGGSGSGEGWFLEPGKEMGETIAPTSGLAHKRLKLGLHLGTTDEQPSCEGFVS